MTIYAADVSYFQAQVNDSYNLPWLIFRCCDGDFLDPNAIGNADWARGANASGKMLGWTTYVVYRPGMNSAVMANLAKIDPLDRVMIDVESWGGQIQGDHSAEINQLADLIAAKVGQANTWIYGNVYDLAAIAPGRYSWLQVVAAGYGTVKPNVPNMIGWQYTEGQTASGSRPLSSPPFGACDHNELYVDSPSPQGGGTPITGDDDMPLNDADKAWINAAIAGQLNTYFATGEGNPNTGRVVQAVNNAVTKYFATGEGNPITGRIVQACQKALKLGPSA